MIYNVASPKISNSEITNASCSPRDLFDTKTPHNAVSVQQAAVCAVRGGARVGWVVCARLKDRFRSTRITIFSYGLLGFRRRCIQPLHMTTHQTLLLWPPQRNPHASRQPRSVYINMFFARETRLRQIIRLQWTKEKTHFFLFAIIIH